MFKELGVAFGGHTLMRRQREIAIVVADKHRYAARDGLIDLIGGLAPLLHGVVQKDVFVHVVGNLGELVVIFVAQLHNGNLFVLAKGGDQFLVQVLALLVAKRELERVMIEGNGHQAAVDVGKHLVLVVGPVGKA